MRPLSDAGDEAGAVRRLERPSEARLSADELADRIADRARAGVRAGRVGGRGSRSPPREARPPARSAPSSGRGCSRTWPARAQRGSGASRGAPALPAFRPGSPRSGRRHGRRRRRRYPRARPGAPPETRRGRRGRRHSPAAAVPRWSVSAGTTTIRAKWTPDRAPKSITSPLATPLPISASNRSSSSAAPSRTGATTLSADWYGTGSGVEVEREVEELRPFPEDEAR